MGFFYSVVRAYRSSGVEAANLKLFRQINIDKYDQGIGLGFLHETAYRAAKSGDGIRMLLDMKNALEQVGGYQSNQTYSK